MKFGFVEKIRLVQRARRYRNRTERGPVRFMLKRLRRGQTVLDVGANKGAYTYWMCKRAGRKGKVFAFEPQPHFVRYLKAAKKAFGFTQLSIVPMALSSNLGERELFLPADNPDGGASFEVTTGKVGSRIRVPIVTLDAFLAGAAQGRRIDLIKCDVEGHEYDVFSGARATLESDRPVLLFECQDFRHPQGQIKRVFSLLRELRYEGFFFDETGRLCPVDEFRVPVHQAAFGSGYLDNFVFLPSDSA